MLEKFIESIILLMSGIIDIIMNLIIEIILIIIEK